MFILAASGAAIGLNNVWNFPYLLSKHGGSAFLLVYLLALMFIGFPLLISEILIGRRGGFSPINSVRLLINRDTCDGRWTLLGWIGTFVGLLVLSYLSVVASWTIAYAFRAGAGAFNGLTADGINGRFYAMVSDPEKQLFWHSFFIFITMMINACGLNVGMQRFVRYGVPALFVMLGVMVLYSIAIVSPGQVLVQLFAFDWEQLGSEGVMLAVSHAVFSLGLGVGVLIVYSAHLGAEASLPRVSASIIGLDTLAGLMAAFVVISLLSRTDLTEISGPALVFQSIPLVLDKLTYGNFIGTLFFLTLALAAWLSSIALVEPVISWLVESWGMKRPSAAVIIGLIAWLLGLFVILSFSYWQFNAELLGLKIRRGYFDILQFATAYVLVPASLILTTVFLGWGLRRETLKEELPFLGPKAFLAWRWSLRVVIPAIIVYLFYYLYQMNP